MIMALYSVFTRVSQPESDFGIIFQQLRLFWASEALWVLKDPVWSGNKDECVKKEEAGDDASSEEGSS